MHIQTICGDLTKQPDVQAIVNSANANLRFGSGVAGAVHSAAGPELEAFCKSLAPIKPGNAVITPAFNLPNEFVIHAVAAHYLNVDDAELLLASAYDASFRLANENEIGSLAIPAIGIGVFRFPYQLAAQIMSQAIVRHERADSSLKMIRICLSSPSLVEVFQQAMQISEPGDR